jgi:hypothetical protein
VKFCIPYCRRLSITIFSLLTPLITYQFLNDRKMSLDNIKNGKLFLLHLALLFPYLFDLWKTFLYFLLFFHPHSNNNKKKLFFTLLVLRMLGMWWEFIALIECFNFNILYCISIHLYIYQSLNVEFVWWKCDNRDDVTEKKNILNDKRGINKSICPRDVLASQLSYVKFYFIKNVCALCESSSSSSCAIV